jgi:hypothetical protein
LKKYKGVIALSFGGGTEVNVKLAELVKGVIAQGLPDSFLIIVQKEVSDFLGNIPRITIGGDKHLNTYEILSRARKEALKENIDFTYIIAHPAMLSRTKTVARNLGFSLLDYKIPPLPYSADDDQKWTRGQLRFWFREYFVAWPWFFFKGYV